MLEQVENIKFQSDARTGLTHFDRVREVAKETLQEVERLKMEHERNLARLIHAT